jgi:exodeoxyribonuclease VII large subunit
VLLRARHLATLSRVPAAVVDRQRGRLHQLLRELRASALRRGMAERGREVRVHGATLDRRAAAARGAEAAARRAKLDALASALAAHDPERIVARGYAVVSDGAGVVVTSASQARAARRVRLFFGDADVRARIEEEEG